MEEKVVANGGNEGLARCLSQAVTYVFELHKTSIQVHGKSPTWTPIQWARNISCGIWQSSLSAGLVFHMYFSIYHHVSASHLALFAGPIASFVTSGIKIPIGNCMRVVQASPKLAPTIMHAGLTITRNRGIGGLYSGYFLSLIEDIIEMDVRIRMYDAGMAISDGNGFVVGAIAGATAAAITTPFDTLRARLAFQASTSTHRQTGVQCLAALCNQKTMPAALGILYRGCQMRALSTGIKAALFYGILENMKPKTTKTSKTINY